MKKKEAQDDWIRIVRPFKSVIQEKTGVIKTYNTTYWEATMDFPSK